MVTLARFGRGRGPRKFYFFFFATEEGVTHSLVAGILIECEEYERRCRNVDANVIRVLPREVAQAVMVLTTLVLLSWVGDVGKELPRAEPVVCKSFKGGLTLEHI